MTDDEIINLAILELRNSDKVYKMFSEFSFMEGLEKNDSKYNKIRYMLIKSEPFEKHSDHSIRLSAVGIKIINDNKDWFQYKKSLKPKKDYVKLGSLVVAVLSLVWNIFQGIHNDSLKKEKIMLIKSQDSLKNQIIQFKDTIMKINLKLDEGTTKEINKKSD